MDAFETYGNLLWGALFIGAGALWLVHAKRTLRHAKESASWPRVGAEITELALRLNRGRNSTTYSPTVSYMYQHEGRWITGERIAFSEKAYGTREEAEDVLARYAGGTRVSVSVAPHDHELSVLEAGVTSSDHMSRWLALGLTAAGALLLALAGTEMIGGPLTRDGILAQVGFGFAVFAAGAGFTWYFHRQARHPPAAWPAVMGVLTEASVREVTYRDHASDSKTTTWRPFLAYTYEAEGKTRAGHAVRFETPGGFAVAPEECEAVASRYRGQREVSVHVSPFDPSVSFVEPPAPQTGMVAVVACAVLALVGLAMSAEALFRGR